MVGVVIDCRLGNQLFQYAFIKALAIRLNTGFCINESVEKFIVADYFDLPGYHPALNYGYKLYFKFRYGNLLKSLQAITVEDTEADSNEVTKDGLIYRGYFQSELFFQNIAHHLASFVQVKKTIAAQFNKQYGTLFQNHKVIAVHIRRGDYLNLNDWWAINLGSNNLSLPAAYFLDCIKKIDHFEDYKLIFLSDDIPYAQETFSQFPNALFAGADMMTDFQILMNADVCILSPSSFAWWAARLNSKPNKKIFCPNYWLGFKICKEYPSHIICNDWIKVDVPA